MNELSSLGLILLLALLAGHLVKFVRVPEVTGYLLAGIALGPSLLGWISERNLGALEVFSEVALGMILFSLGAVFEFAQFRRLGTKLLLVTLAESAGAFALVAGGMALVGQPWPVSLLLGAIAMETGAASTLMVLRESDAAGPFTDAITGLIALNNLACLVTCSMVFAVLEWVGAGSQTPTRDLYATVFPLVWQLVGSAALGYLVGLLLAGWSSRVEEHGERLILLAGCVLLCVGVARALDLSGLVASLAVGATLANLSQRSAQLFRALGQTDPPLYAIFFVIAGADLDVSLLGSVGLLGLVYVAARAAGKLAGVRFGAQWAGLPRPVPQLGGFGLFAHAGLAIGLSLTVSRRFPDLAPTVVTVTLASVLVYEIIGPIAVRVAIHRSGESKRVHNEQPVVALD